MLTVVNTKLGESRGVSRIWLEGRKLGLASFQPGQPLSVTFDKASKKVCLKVAANAVSYTHLTLPTKRIV